LSVAGPYIHEKVGGKIAIGAEITVVQSNFKALFNLTNLRTDGSQFDRLFKDGDEFSLGSIQARVMHTPGHVRRPLISKT